MFFPFKGGTGRVRMKESDTLTFLLVGGGGDGDMTEWWEISKI